MSAEPTQQDKDQLRVRVKQEQVAAINLLFEPDDTFETRLLRVDEGRGFKGQRFGYYKQSSKEKLVADLWPYHWTTEGCYTTINPVNPNLLARSANRLQKTDNKTALTTDIDIIERRWIPIDLDPVRPSGISSSDLEHQQSIDKAKQIRDFLAKDIGIPQNSLVLCDSGNGCHLLIKIKLPNDEVSKELVKQFLKALDNRFSDSWVKVDTTMYNASRIIKLYGSRPAKGDPTEDRPHRHAKILEAPETLSLCPIELIEKVASLAPPEEKRNFSAGSASNVFTLPRKQGSSVGQDNVIDRARKYLAHIPGAVSSQNGHGATFYAANVLINGFALSLQDAFSLLVEWNQTCAPPWSDAELRHKLDDAERKGSNRPRGYLLNQDRVNEQIHRRWHPECLADVNLEEIEVAYLKLNSLVRIRGQKWQAKVNKVEGREITVFFKKQNSLATFDISELLYWDDNKNRLKPGVKSTSSASTTATTPTIEANIEVTFDGDDESNDSYPCAENDESEEQQKQKTPLSLPLIHTDAQLSEIFDQARDALIQFNDPPVFFRKQNLIVRLIETEFGTATQVCDEDILHGYLARCADWVTQDDQGQLKPSKPPKDVSRDLLVNLDQRLPDLTAILRAPCLVGNELVTEPGYHPDLKVYYAPAKDFNLPAIQGNPSLEDVVKAKELLLEDVFGDFPFENKSGAPLTLDSPNSERANCIAALLTPFTKHSYRGNQPMVLTEAPSVGAGKTKLVKIIGIISNGTEPAIKSFPTEEAEVRKSITSTLLEGRDLLIFDNMNGKLESDALAGALTSRVWTDRLLGVSQNVTVPNNLFILATANNLVLTEDFPRRVIRVRLDPQTEKPWQTSPDQFKHPQIEDWCTTNRGEIVAAILTLINYWRTNGKPLGNKLMGSFENWSGIIGGILECCGINGFLENIDENFDLYNQQNEPWFEFIEKWWEKYEHRTVLAADLNALCREHNLMTIIRGDKPTSESMRLGRALMKVRGKIFRGFKLETGAMTSNGSGSQNGYRLVKLNLPNSPSKKSNVPPNADFSQTSQTKENTQVCEKDPYIINNLADFAYIADNFPKSAHTHTHAPAPARAGIGVDNKACDVCEVCLSIDNTGVTDADITQASSKTQTTDDYLSSSQPTFRVDMPELDGQPSQALPRTDSRPQDPQFQLPTFIAAKALAESWIMLGILKTLPFAISLPDDTRLLNPSGNIKMTLYEINNEDEAKAEQAMQDLPPLVAKISWYLARQSQSGQEHEVNEATVGAVSHLDSDTQSRNGSISEGEGALSFNLFLDDADSEWEHV